MSAGQLAEGHGDGPADEGGGEKAENGGGSGDFESRAGAEQEAGADRSTDRDHSHLSGGEAVLQAFFVGMNGNLGRGGLRRHGARYQKVWDRPRVELCAVLQLAFLRAEEIAPDPSLR